jgi:hypothetical protein
MMTWKGFGWKRSWPHRVTNLEFARRKITKSLRITGVPADILTAPSDMNPECYHCNNQYNLPYLLYLGYANVIFFPNLL